MCLFVSASASVRRFGVWGALLNLGMTGNLHNGKEWQPAEVSWVDGAKRAGWKQTEQAWAWQVWHRSTAKMNVPVNGTLCGLSLRVQQIKSVSVFCNQISWPLSISVALKQGGTVGHTMLWTFLLRLKERSSLCHHFKMIWRTPLSTTGLFKGFIRQEMNKTQSAYI